MGWLIIETCACSNIFGRKTENLTKNVLDMNPISLEKEKTRRGTNQDYSMRGERIK